MEGHFIKGERMDSCPQLLDLMHEGCRELMAGDGGGGGGGHGYQVAEERKLELRLAPPGGEEWPSALQQKGEENSAVLSLNIFSTTSSKINTNNHSAGAKRGFTATLEPEHQGFEQQQKNGFVHFQAAGGIGKESSQKTFEMKAEQQMQVTHERMACSKAASPAIPDASRKPTGTNRSQTRISPAPVVGWPPIRSFRKNIASSSSKPSPASEKLSENNLSHKSKKPEVCTKGMFVKINMDGIPIGRKVDLKIYNSYEGLSAAVDELFRGLMAAQRETPAPGTINIKEENPKITGLLDGSGDYTLVYEDNEGDRMLVGDVPWNMFLSSVKRLRVLKSSDLSSTLTLGAAKRNRTAEPEKRVP